MKMELISILEVIYMKKDGIHLFVENYVAPNKVLHKVREELIEDTELTDIFKGAKITDYGMYEHPGDELGKSKVTTVYFDFISKDTVNLGCVDWSKEIEKGKRWIDHLAVHLDSKEYDYWINNEAY